jgi:hypothetical protein
MSVEISKTPSRAELLKQLREAHQQTVERTQALYKIQRQMENSICQLIRTEPKTVPQIATAIGKPALVCFMNSKNMVL